MQWDISMFWVTYMAARPDTNTRIDFNTSIAAAFVFFMSQHKKQIPVVKANIVM